MTAKRVLVLAPFAADSSHLGSRRVDRFCRWMASGGFVPQVVCPAEAEPRDRLSVFVPDPLGLSSRPHTKLASAHRTALRGTGLGARLLVPDPSVAWCVRAALSPAVHAAARGSSLIISTGPPESPHVLGALLSRKTGTPHLVDYRDGWTDEPLKASLEAPGPRLWIERALERHVLQSASVVTVSSEGWRDCLVQRHPNIAARVVVLTNPVPSEVCLSADDMGFNPDLLLYSGRIQASSGKRQAIQLLEYLEAEARHCRLSMEVQFRGDFTEADLYALGNFSARVAKHSWRVVISPSIAYGEALQELPSAMGLLMLSCSQNAIPSKTYDYIGSGRPFMCMAPIGSAVWDLCADLPQAWRVDVERPMKSLGFTQFCRTVGRAVVPDSLTERTLRQRFVELLRDASNRQFWSLR